MCLFKDLFKKGIYTVLLIIVPVSLVIAQSGKIAGEVTDSETGEPLPGVNVIVEGTQLGAATDADGFYNILNVPPGEYSVSASFIGYAEVTKTNVLVETDQTRTLGFQLTPSAIQGEAITVEAEREIVQMDRSASEVSATSEEIENVPTVSSVEQFLSMQAGVEGLAVRGGGLDQTNFLMDGVTMVDNRANEPMMMVNLSAIQEISIIKGGFNAEYGNVRSGLLNIVTKDGSADRYHGSVDYRYSPPRYKHYGDHSLFTKNQYYTRPYLEEADSVMWLGTDVWPEEVQDSYPEFIGWIEYSDRLMSDEDPTNDRTPEEARDLYLYAHRMEGSSELGQHEGRYGHRPDWQVDGSFGGPVPLVSDMLGVLRFFVSHKTDWDLFKYPVIPDSRQYLRRNSTQLKLTSNVTQNMKLRINGMWGETHSVSNGAWGMNSYATADWNVGSGSGNLFDPASHFVPFDIYRGMLSMSIDHNLSQKTFYSLNIGMNRTRNWAPDPYAVRDTSTVRYFGNTPVNERPYGYWWQGGPESMQDGVNFNGQAGHIIDTSFVTTTNLKFDITSQVNRYHQLKSGIIINYDDIYNYWKHEREFTPIHETYSEWRRYPIRAGAYIQDKIEFEGMIANLGVRVDYNNPNTFNYQLDPYSNYYTAPFYNNFQEVVPKEDAKSRVKVSPRLGISHPISERAKLYFNYGHFYSMPSTNDMFRIQGEGVQSGVDALGNPNLDIPRTVAYELGVETNIGNLFMIHLSGYYKDVSNQVAWVEYTGFDGRVDYGTYRNQNYEDIRGFELRIDKRFGKWFTGWINYDYMVETWGYIGRQHYYEDPRQQRLYGLQNPFQQRPLPRPQLRANILFTTPPQYGLSLGRFHPLGGWRIGLLYQWQAGDYFTWDPLETNELDRNQQWAPFHQTDLRIAKDFDLIRGTRVRIFADIFNVFNYLHYSGAGFASGTDYRQYMESLKLPQYEDVRYQNEGMEPGDDRPGDVKSEDKPYINMPNVMFRAFSNMRYAEFGIKLEF
jgi:hypothetical protein